MLASALKMFTNFFAFVVYRRKVSAVSTLVQFVCIFFVSFMLIFWV